MNINKHLLTSAAAIVTFSIGLSAYSGSQYLLSLLTRSPVSFSAKDSDSHQLLPTLDIERYYMFAEVPEKGFRDFSYIEIKTNPLSLGSKGVVVSDRAFEIISIASNFEPRRMNSQSLMIETETIREVSFTFTGRVEKSSSTGNIQINGSLTKIKNGQTIASTGVTLYGESH